MKMSKSSMNDSVSPENIFETARAFQESRVLLTAYELDIFTILGDESKSSAEVSETLGTGVRATERLMNALCAVGFLEKNKGKFSNTSLTSQFLVKGKPDYMAGLMHSVNLWESWSTLTDAVKKGKSVIERTPDKREKEWRSAFIAAMHEGASKRAQDVVEMLGLSGVERVLDVGGGSGAYSIAFVRAKDGLRASVFDLPNIIPLTESYIEKEGLSDKVETIAGDYNVDELGSGFDLVFLSSIVHINSFEGNQKLIRKCSNALNTTGQVAIQDFIVDEDGTSPAHCALFALNMLVATESGDTYTESEVRTWMEDAGLSEIVRKDTNFGTAIIIGKKVKK